MWREGFAALSLCVLMGGTVQAETLVERGNYLVNTVMTCGNCHSPKGPTGDIAGREFSGGLSWDDPPFKVTAPNITQDKDTGIGAWTDAQIKTVLRTGIMPNGAHVAMVMPTGFYHILTDRDLDSIVAYLRTLKPIKNEVPAPVYKMPQAEHVLPGAEKPYTEAMLTDKVTKGFYLATIAHCMECHTPMGPRGREWATKLGAGGFEMPGPWGMSVSRNRTDVQIQRAILQGVDKAGNHLKPPMGFPYYAKMAEGDVDAIVAYLRTVPPQE